MKHKVVLPSLAVWVLIASAACAQGLTLSLNVSSHPNPYLAEWETRRETAILTITNLTGATVQARLHARILLDGELKAETKTDKMPTLDIAPGVSMYMGDELVPGYAVKFYGDVDKTARHTGMLPAGMYEFCVELVDAEERTVSGPVCRPFVVTDYQLPTLIQPGGPVADGPSPETSLRIGTRPTFRWTPVIPMPPGGTIYRVMLFEILEGQYPMQAFRANQPVMDVEVRQLTQLLWPVDVPLPDSPRTMLWSVQSLDLNGRPIGDRDGYSEPYLLNFVSAPR